MSVSLQQQIINTYYTDYKFFFSKPNVVGIAYGYKITNDIITCEPSIHVYVKKKISLNCLPTNGLIPPLYKDIKTDVIETGEFTAGSSLLNNSYQDPAPYASRVRPIQPGYCISTSYSSRVFFYTGTLGYIVTDNEQVSKTYCLLSINKTFAAFNQYPIGGEILQPSTEFGGKIPQDIVGKLLRYCPLKLTPLRDPTPPLSEFNTVDGSIASLVQERIPSLINPFIPPTFLIPTGITTTTRLLQSVQWTGCHSGYHRGTILSVASLFQIYCYDDFYAWFKDIILVNSSFGGTRNGDMGALICGLDKKAIGLLSGHQFETNGLKYYNLICPINPVLQNLNVTLLIRDNGMLS